MKFQLKKLKTLCLCLPLTVLIGCSSGDSETLKLGEEVVSGTCIVCHAAGINGAPIIGNSNMWGPRVGQGIPALVEHASNGYGLMPAKGGNTDLTEEQITAAVTYMLSQLD